MTNRGSTTTPAEDGFYLPPDACRHARTWMAWPARAEAEIAAALAELVRSLADYEPVSVIAPTGRERAIADITGTDNITVTELPHGSARLRDTGPMFLVDGKGGAAAVDWRFTGWADAEAGTDDRVLAHALLGHAEVRRFRAGLSMAGGALTGDGFDTVVVLAPAVFGEGRNSATRLEAFGALQQWLGVSRAIWLERPLPGDATAAEVRALCAFVAPGTVAVPRAARGDHPQGAVLAETAKRLSAAKDARGQALTVVPLPVPTPMEHEGALLPLSYAAFYPANGVVLMPAFGDEAADDEAAEELARLFPGRKVRPVTAALTLAKAGLSVASLCLPHPARLLERDRATVLPRSAWSKPAPDYDALIQKYIDMAEGE